MRKHLGQGEEHDLFRLQFRRIVALAIWCALLGAHACRVLIGTCNPWGYRAGDDSAQWQRLDPGYVSYRAMPSNLACPTHKHRYATWSLTQCACHAVKGERERERERV